MFEFGTLLEEFGGFLYITVGNGLGHGGCTNFFTYELDIDPRTKRSDLRLRYTIPPFFIRTFSNEYTIKL